MQNPQHCRGGLGAVVAPCSSSRALPRRAAGYPPPASAGTAPGRSLAPHRDGAVRPRRLRGRLAHPARGPGTPRLRRPPRPRGNLAPLPDRHRAAPGTWRRRGPPAPTGTTAPTSSNPSPALPGASWPPPRTSSRPCSPRWTPATTPTPWPPWPAPSPAPTKATRGSREDSSRTWNSTITWSTWPMGSTTCIGGSTALPEDLVAQEIIDNPSRPRDDTVPSGQRGVGTPSGRSS